MKQQKPSDKSQSSKKLKQAAEKPYQKKDKDSKLEKTESLQDLNAKKLKKQQLEILAEKLQQAESDNLYLRAEFENFKKRSLEDQYKALRYEGEKFISSLATEVLDDLDRALAVSRDNKSLTDLQKGLEMIHKKTNKLLNRFGVEVLDPKGKAFDPSSQEALNFVKSSEVPEDHVLETYKKAYKMHEKIIRPAQVIVAKREES